jgi:hypothetical protein
LIDAAVESQWQVVEEEAQLLSDQVAYELESVADASDTAPSKKPSHKKKKKTAANKIEPPPRAPFTKEEKGAARDDEVKVGERQASLHESTAATVEQEDANTDDWVTATKKKTSTWKRAFFCMGKPLVSFWWFTQNGKIRFRKILLLLFLRLLRLSPQ